MFDSIITKVILGWIRHAVGAAGGGLIANGYVSQSDWQTVVGAIMTIVPIAFSAYDKFQAAQTAAKAAQTGVAK